LNASIDSDRNTVTYHGRIHLNIAVDTDRGLIAPVLRNADTYDLAGISTQTVVLATKARENTLSADDLVGGTFTITNTGSRGALFDTPIINQPQVAILGTGAVVQRPVVMTENGKKTIGVRAMAYLALTYDHRLIDGADAARFLATVKDKIEHFSFDRDFK
jgi:pyruvate dehydrogenase E2 component (dihydrolipoamide acetyltransferase)